MKKYFKTKTTNENILDRVDEWVDKDAPDCELYEFLGISREEYGRWVETGELQ